MADATYGPKVYMEQGGDRQVVASGGSLDVESGGEIDFEAVSLLKIVGGRGLCHGRRAQPDGRVTATTAELNILDGVTSTAAELNILDGVTADKG